MRTQNQFIMSDKIRKISFWRVFFPTLIALLLASVISIIFFFSSLVGFINKYAPETAMQSESEVKENTFLKMSLSNTVGDVGFQKFNTSNFSMITQSGLGEIIYGLQKAKEDPNVKGIYINAGDVAIGYGNLMELREALMDFEKSGKKVVVYANGEAITTKLLYLSTVTKDSYVFPESNVEFLGLSGQIMFFKGLLDKLKIDVKVIRGEGNVYKSAVEPYFRTDMSDSSRLQTERYLNGIWNQVLTDIAKDRKLTVAKLNELASNARITKGSDAVKYGLISATKYEDEILDILKKYAGVKETKDINYYDFDKYARNEFRKQVKLKEDKESIALIFAEGDISKDGDGIASNRTVTYLREARNNDKIKTIVLRVNSPGGSALASEEIWREVHLAAQKKKVYVSMGNLAASGGYYISSAGTRIFADPTTITGSIGVFGVIPNFGKALNSNLGITFDDVKTNKFANISLMREMTPEEEAIIQKGVNDIYHQFLKRVSDGRKISVEKVQNIAKGRVWLGMDAVKIGLVDEMGGLVKTINYAKKQVGDLPIAVWPKVQDSDLRDLMEVFNKNKDAIQSNDAKISTEMMDYYRDLQRLENHFGMQMRMPLQVKF